MNWRRWGLWTSGAVLAAVAATLSRTAAQDLPPPLSPTLTCNDGTASIPENTTLVSQLSCAESGLLQTLAAGYIRTVAGTGSQGFTGDGGPATEATLSLPHGVAVDDKGNLHIGDSANSAVRRVDAATGVITTIAGTGTPGFGGDDGLATEALLSEPRRVTLDAAGNVFIADVNNARIRRVDATTGIITTVVGGGAAGGVEGVPATDADLLAVAGIAFDTSGAFFLVEVGRSRIRRVSSGADNLITGAADEIITTVAGTGAQGFSGDGGPALEAQFSFLEDIDFGGQGSLFVADRQNGRIRRISPGSDGLITGAGDEVVTTVAGGGDAIGDGIPATTALLNVPRGVAVDLFGNIFISEAGALKLRRVDAVTGLISTVVGGGTALGSDIPAATARQFNPRGLDTDVEGNLFIAEQGSSRIRAVRLAPPAIFEIVDAPAHGTATVTSMGELTYEPDSDFVGADSLTFHAVDAAGRPSPPATFVVTMTPVLDADVEVSETVSPTGGISADGTITYAMTVTNHGPAAADDVGLSSTLPDGINLSHVSATPSQGACTRAGSIVTCAFGTIGNDASVSATIVVHPLDTSTKTNTVTVVTSAPDPDSANNTVSVSSTLSEVALTDLTVSATATPEPVLVGTPLTYAITVANLQNRCAAGVMLTDTLAGSVTLVSITPSQGTCTGLQCSLGTLCPGQSASVTIITTPTTVGSIVNTATIPDRPSDPAGNNTVNSTTTVVPASPAVIRLVESIRVGDVVRTLPAAMIRVSEQITVADTTRVLPPVVIRVSESVRVNDATVARPPVVIRITETVRVTDTPTVR